jgi:DNA-binding transcriptional MerR regulator
MKANRKTMRDILTIAEVVELVRRLDERRGLGVSARQLRYWDTALSFGAGRATDTPNAARTFTPADVAVVRLVRRLQRDDVRDRAIWALLLHLGGQLRRAMRHGSTAVLWMEANGRAHLLTARAAADKPVRECYPLAEVVTGIREAIRSLRTGDYEIWNGARLVPARELVAVT